jgi:predicted phage terminase large subunit-like protein
MVAVSVWEHVARAFEPRPRTWASPLALAQHLDPATVRTPALDLIDSALVDTEAGRGPDRLQIFMPPQEGKSTTVSRRYPLWLLEHDPTLLVGIVSYGADLAVEFGRQVKRDVEQHPDLGIQLRADSRAAGRWNTKQGGGLYCVGLAGGLSGRPLDRLIYDDLIKDRQQAESAAHRQRCWDHWEQVGRPRLSARGRVTVMQTRWHTDDLPGRLQAQELQAWRVIAVPAVAGDGDLLGRAPGEELRSARGRAPGYFLGLQASMSPYAWRSIYQQAPTGAQGTLFQRDAWRFFDHVDQDSVVLDGRRHDLRDMWRFATVDLAGSTRTASDFSVVGVWAMTGDRDLLLLDVARARAAEADHWALVRPLLERWRVGEVGVESTMIGTALIRDAVAGGLPGVFDLHADRDKITRAIPYSSLQRQRRVWLRAGAAWIDDWVSEHADFPNGPHDDQVDVGAYAAKQVLVDWHPTPGQAEPANGHGEVDFMRVQL